MVREWNGSDPEHHISTFAVPRKQPETKRVPDFFLPQIHKPTIRKSFPEHGVTESHHRPLRAKSKQAAEKPSIRINSRREPRLHRDAEIIRSSIRLYANDKRGIHLLSKKIQSLHHAKGPASTGRGDDCLAYSVWGFSHFEPERCTVSYETRDFCELESKFHISKLTTTP